jgi:hypothetical protein
MMMVDEGLRRLWWWWWWWWWWVDPLMIGLVGLLDWLVGVVA